MRTRTLLPALLATALTTGGLTLVSATAADAATVIDVSTAAQLKTALAAAVPGDTIRLADGTYTGNTGHDGRGMGEGVYVGTAGDLTDRSDQVQILNNTIGPGVGGETSRKAPPER